MKIRHILNLTVVLLLAFCSCKKEETKKLNIPHETKVSKESFLNKVDTTAAIIERDTITIIQDPFKSGDYPFAESADVFMERFNAIMKKSGWNMRLKKGWDTETEEYNTRTMVLTDSINIVAKLRKNDNQVIKIIMFGKDRFDAPSTMPIIKAMRGMILSGPGHRHLSADEAEVILYKAGTLGDKNIFPQGLCIQDGIRYEVGINLNRVIFGVGSE